MRWRPKISAYVLVLLVSLNVGCKSPSEYAKFAQSGNLYVAALDNLMVAATRVTIDASSERFVLDDAVSNTSKEDYDRQNDADKRRIEVYGKLRRHGRLLGEYFDSLNALATSEAPDTVQAATSSLVTNINTLGTELRGSPLLRGGGEAIPLLTKLIVSSAIRGALKSELDARSQTIREELALQETLLKALAKDIQDDLKTIEENEAQRLVVDPLLAVPSIQNIETWKENRRRILLYPSAIQELESASSAVGNLRQAFEDLLSNRLTLERINGVIADFESIITIAESIQKELK